MVVRYSPGFFHSRCRAIVLVAIALGGCHAPTEPVREHLAIIDGMVADRAISPMESIKLLQIDPRVEIAPPTGVLTFREAIDRTLGHNLSLIANAENLPIAQAQLAAAGLWQSPTLGQTGALFFPLSGQGGLPSWDVEIGQLINTFFTRPHKVAVAESQRFQAGIDLASQGFDLAEQAAAKYNEMTHLLRDRKLSEKVAGFYYRAWTAAEARMKVGLIPRPDVNRAKLQYEDAQRQLRHLKTQYARTAREMNWLMGISSSPQWQLPADAGEAPRDLAGIPDSTELERLGHGHRLDFLRADFDRKIATTNVTLAKLGMIPQFNLLFDISRDGAKKYSGGPAFNMELPIFDNGKVAVTLAEAQLRLTSKSYIAMKGQVSQDVRTAYDNVRTSQEDVLFYRDRQIPQEEENVRLSELSFRLGNTDLDDLLNTLREYVSTLQAYEDALDTYGQNVIALERAVGMVLPRMTEEAAKHGIAVTLPTLPATLPAESPTTRSSTQPTTLPAMQPTTPPSRSSP